MKMALLSIAIITFLIACRQEFHPLSPPDSTPTPPVSATITQPASPNSDCPNKTFAQNLPGWWTYSSNRLVNPNGGSTKFSGRIKFKADMSFEDPDTLFGYRLQNEPVLARLYEVQGNNLLMYITDKLERQQGVILVLQTANCNELKFVGIGKGGDVKIELTR